MPESQGRRTRDKSAAIPGQGRAFVIVNDDGPARGRSW
jgi:hypothetical protein